MAVPFLLICANKPFVEFRNTDPIRDSSSSRSSHRTQTQAIRQASEHIKKGFNYYYKTPRWNEHHLEPAREWHNRYVVVLGLFLRCHVRPGHHHHGYSWVTAAAAATDIRYRFRQVRFFFFCQTVQKIKEKCLFLASFRLAHSFAERSRHLLEADVGVGCERVCLSDDLPNRFLEICIEKNRNFTSNSSIDRY